MIGGERDTRHPRLGKGGSELSLPPAILLSRVCNVAMLAGPKPSQLRRVPSAERQHVGALVDIFLLLHLSLHRQMATAQHYVWAAGHFLILLTATKYLFTSFMFRYASPTWYKASYFGALVSYSIVCLKSLGVPQPNSTFARRAATDDNVHYLLLALFWFFSKPVPLSLVPYAIFSLFHALTFLRSNALPHFFPPSPPATAGEPAQQHPLLKRIQVWIKTNYDTAMTVVAYTELAILARVIFGALFRMNSLLSPILFAHFVRQRYYQSTFTQRAVAHVNTFVDFYVQKPATPPIVKTIWAQAQVLVGRWAGSVLTRQQPNPTNGARRPTRG